MASQKHNLIDLFKTPDKIKPKQYTSLENKIKADKRIEDETTDMMIILYCFIFLFALVFIMTVIYSDDINKYKIKTSNAPSLWDSIKLKLFGIPKYHPPSNCYISTKNTCNSIDTESTNNCINKDGKTCQAINEEWRKSLNSDNTSNINENICTTVKYPYNIEIDTINQCLKK
jgi:hypothetical protein